MPLNAAGSTSSATESAISKMVRLTLEKFSATEYTDELSITRGDLAAHRHNMRPAFGLKAFKRIIIDVHLMSLHGNLSAVVRIVDDEISVTSDSNRAFAWKQSKKLRCLGAGGINKPLDVDLAGFHT